MQNKDLELWVNKEEIKFDHDNKVPYTWGTDTANTRLCKPEGDDLAILIGAPGMGKTEYSYFVARENVKLGNKVLYLSLELNKSALYKRLAIRKAGLRYIDVQNLSYNEEQQGLLDKELEQLQNQIGIEILGAKKDPTIKQVSDIIRLYKDDGYNMFIVDNLGKISKENKSEIEAFEIITSALQNLKDEIMCPIILLHHTVKPPKTQGDNAIQGKKPAGRSGFRGSQKIEDNCTILQEIRRDTTMDDTGTPDKDVDIYQYKHTKSGITDQITLEFQDGDYLKKEFIY